MFILKCVTSYWQLGTLFFCQVCSGTALEGILDRHKQMAKLLSKCMLFFSICLNIWLDFSCAFSPPFFTPSFSTPLFVLITTKPCHHSSWGHVNQPGQHHLFPAVYLQPNKGVCLFVVAGEECCVGWGLLFNSARRYQPPTLKRPIQHRESMEKERREDVIVGVVGYLETISNLSFPKEPRQTGHKGGTSQANVKSK